ncbi:hypothetical protein BJ138DRAFT_1098293 [Hygrophoropsis aurantiaca]|uniref:Uncharacterized protein n=1 Tax=Hygrophoropsis aurantiaca TaxID=72124 RepID=A0ACB8AMW7_9AGAM|nr:hypothetical protein BJ138DRAFT_1098293 [Hygrophoropsis aurantiaca]
MSSVVIPYSPDWLPTLEGGAIEGYLIVVTPVIIFYDYAITFSRESSPLSLMSSLYVIGRFATIGTVMEPPEYTATSLSKGKPIMFDNLLFIIAVTWIVFTSQLAFRGIMVLRIYAMYQQSRIVLVFLVVALAAQVISYVVMEALYFGPVGQLQAEEVIIGNTYNCVYFYESNLISFAILPQFLFALAIFVMAVACFVRHLSEARKISKTLKVNEFLSILAKDSTVYFFLLLFASAFKLGNHLATNSAVVGSFVYSGLTGIFIDVQEYLLVPHLVLSFKERHAQLVDGSDSGTQMETIAFERGASTTGDPIEEELRTVVNEHV